MKEVCKKCAYWTGVGYQRYKCYTKGCPAKERDEAAKDKKRKKKMKIEFKPNFATMMRDPHDYSYTIVVTNPRACRKRDNDAG